MEMIANMGGASVLVGAGWGGGSKKIVRWGGMPPSTMGDPAFCKPNKDINHKYSFERNYILISE